MSTLEKPPFEVTKDNEVLNTIPHIGICDAGGTISSLMTPGGFRVGAQRDLMGMLQARNPSFVAGRFNIGETQTAYRGLSENMSDDDIDHVIKTTENMIDTGVYNAILGWTGSDRHVDILRKMANKQSLLEKIKTRRIPIIITCAEDDPDKPESDVWSNLEGSLDYLASVIDPDVYHFFHGKLFLGHTIVIAPYIADAGLRFMDIRDEEYWDLIQKIEDAHIVQADALYRYLNQGRGLVEFINAFSPKYFKNTSAHKIAGLTEEQRQEFLLLCDWGLLPSQNPFFSLFGVYPVNYNSSDYNDMFEIAKFLHTKAILLTGYHSGTANTAQSASSVAEMVGKARAIRNIVFFFVTENGQPADLHAYETSVALRKAGVVPLYNMSKEAAVVKLEYAARQANSQVEIIDIMLTNMIGEIDESRINRDDIEELKQLYR